MFVTQDFLNILFVMYVDEIMRLCNINSIKIGNLTKWLNTDGEIVIDSWNNIFC